MFKMATNVMEIPNVFTCSTYARRAVPPFYLINLNCENNLRLNISLRIMFIESEEQIQSAAARN